MHGHSPGTRGPGARILQAARNSPSSLPCPRRIVYEQFREKILVVEDEKSIAHFISTVLTTNGYETMQARSGAEAQSMISSHCPDLIILDLGLPDMDGLEVLRSLRSWSSLPVVVVSARTHERDKVDALDLGADDYLTKPFGTDELLARVRTAIRHTRTSSGNDEIAQKGTYTVGELTIDFNKHQALVRGEMFLDPQRVPHRGSVGQICRQGPDLRFHY